jgi:hypothetical protein
MECTRISEGSLMNVSKYPGEGTALMERPSIGG